MNQSRSKTLLLWASLFALLAPGLALIEKAKFKNDHRHAPELEQFGFARGGTYELRITDFSVNSNDGSAVDREAIKANMGIFVVRTYRTNDFVNVAYHAASENFMARSTVDMANQTEWVYPVTDEMLDTGNMTISRTIKYPGMYHTAWINYPNPESESGNQQRSNSAGRVPGVNFKVHLTQYNPGPDYLSIEDSPLPALFLFFAFATIVILALWVRETFVNAHQSHKIHHLISALALLKVVTLFIESGMYHHLKLHGHTSGWDVAFFIFDGIRVAYLFVVVMLIGSGWSVVTPFMSRHDKIAIASVISLQVLANIAAGFQDGRMRGSTSWGVYDITFHMFDIVCCLIVLVTIDWSVRKLREASAVDGKAALNLTKSKQFKHFYAIVMGYIYATRLLAYILEVILPYQHIWLVSLIVELIRLAFFAFIMVTFRPVANSPYFKLDARDWDEDNNADHIPLESMEPEFSL